MAHKVSIIGTAGRRGDFKKMDKQLYERMVDKAAKVITEDFKLDLDHVHLVSGGAAWADHIAVTLFLVKDIPSLTLHFPSKWEEQPDREKPQFTDNGCGEDWRKNPGAVANTRHKGFSEKIKDNSLKQISSAILTGARYYVHKGFHERNTHVAQSEYLVAFTWSEGSEPERGGTLDTWKKCTGTKHHIPLRSLKPLPSPEKRSRKRKRSRSISHVSESAARSAGPTQKKICFPQDRKL